MKTFKEMLSERNSTVAIVAELEQQVMAAATIIAEAFEHGNKVLICGNGGSAADSQHMAAEFVGRFMKNRKGLPALALTTDTSALTAIGNDWDFNYVFQRQVEAHAVTGDVLIGISTSGKSMNVLNAMASAREWGVTTIGITGPIDAQIKDFSDVLIAVKSNITPVVQERHLIIEHLICELVDEILLREKQEKKKIYCFDIDGTLCTSTAGQYEQARPLKKRIDHVNKLYDAGHRILLYTARGSTTGIDHTDLTREQMGQWGVKYHELKLGKPEYHMIIDDKAINDKDFFVNIGE